MKKLVSIIVLIVVAFSMGAVLTACVNEEEAKLDYLEAEVVDKTTYYINEKFELSTITITAFLTDETEQTVSTSNAGLRFDKSDLKLDENGKFTELGEKTLKIVYLNEYECTVKINVVAK